MSHSTSHIRTERLWLREIDESDTATVVRLRSDPDVYRYFKNPHKLTEEEHISWYRNRYLPDANRTDWIAIDDENGSVVGLFGGCLVYGGAVELSYLLDNSHKKMGYAKEAIESVMAYMGGNPDIKGFTATVHKDNLDSVHFIRQLLFREMKIDGDFVKYWKPV